MATGNDLGLPKPAVDLQPATFNYQVTVALGAQSMNLKVSTVITDGGSSWTAVDTMETPQGSVTDTATIAKSSLTLLKRSLKQGPLDIELDYAGNKAAGNINMSGQDHAVAADLGGPLFADAAGADQVIAALPLADGYTTTFRNFDVQTQKVKLMQLNVASVESVTVPAGKFDTYRVEVTSADGGADKKTLWIAKDSRKVIKVSADSGFHGRRGADRGTDPVSRWNAAHRSCLRIGGSGLVRLHLAHRQVVVPCELQNR